MSEPVDQISVLSVERELKSSYLDYAVSVLVGRAIPDVRDGFKPVHRRILFAMKELHNDWNKPYKKSARIVGEVMGKYHPHGDGAIYMAMVRMAQTFSMRYLLIDGQGNFGSIDGDSPAAMRYTEARMSKLTLFLLDDLDKDTVDFAPNYDNTESMPIVLPARFPNVLVNGSSGIAVGMATNIPPHHLGEVIDAVIHLMDHPNATVEDLMQHIQGPDFPTGGLINGYRGIVDAYKTGRGKIYVRGRAHFENETGDKPTIVITEIPYIVNKLKLVERITEIARDKVVEGITTVRDESDRQGMRVVIETRRGENVHVILNHLYRETQLQVVFGMNFVVLDGQRPKVMNLPQILNAFINHRSEVVVRRTRFELKRTAMRAHLLEGLSVALSHIDEMIALIKAASSPAEAKDKMLERLWPVAQATSLLSRADVTPYCEVAKGYGVTDEGYRLSPDQAQAILDLKLHRLTGLEQDKIRADFDECIAAIERMLRILGDSQVLYQVIKDELLEVKEKFSDGRRTEIIRDKLDLSEEDLIPNDALVVTLSHQGYVKSQLIETYRAQHRGGRGKSATQIKEDDYIDNLLVADAHDNLLFFTSQGRLYCLKAYRIPQAGRQSRGKPLVNLLSLNEDERITAVLNLKQLGGDEQLVMVTARGTIKKTALSLFANPRSSGVIAVNLVEGDQLIGVDISSGDDEIMLFTDDGKAIRFHESQVRSMGRLAAGVRGIRLAEGARVVAMVICHPDMNVLTVSERGYGKCSRADQFRVASRGGQGVIAMQNSERNGQLIGAVRVDDGDELMFISDQGTLVRTPSDEIPVIGRNTQGVKLVALGDAENLIGIRRIIGGVAGEDEGESDSAADASEGEGSDDGSE